jgi:hypothetical protein
MFNNAQHRFNSISQFHTFTSFIKTLKNKSKQLNQTHKLKTNVV